MLIALYFPHNYEFEKDDLVHLWMAEGFIQPQGMKRIEDIGNDYYDNFLWRCFFHIPHFDYLDQPVYHMHGLIHELAQLVSTDICFQMKDGMSPLLPIFRNARHSSFAFSRRYSTNDFEDVSKIQRLKDIHGVL